LAQDFQAPGRRCSEIHQASKLIGVGVQYNQAMAVLASLSPSKNTPVKKTGLKRKSLVSPTKSCEKGRRLVDAAVRCIKLQRPQKPCGEQWPLQDLVAFDAPTERETDMNGSAMLRNVLKARGWRYSTKPCHGTYDKNTQSSTFHIKEFEACLQGQAPEKLFGKNAMVEDGYRLQAIPLPKRALWMMTRLPYRVPGTRHYDREDFINLVVAHGDKLPGNTGNYRMAKFPGTETLLFKTHLTEAFQGKAWYPATYILPKDKSTFLTEIRSRGNSRNNLWIGKPRNDYGGTGIQVFKGTDPDLIKAVQQSDSCPRSLMQHYIADPHLVGGYKYHMRIHLVITNLCPLQAYVQENGQCLFATKPYTLSNKTLGSYFDPPVHVTNMGLNAKPENKENYFSKKPVVGRGQQIRMKELVAHLAATIPSFDKHLLWQEILSIAVDTTRYIAKGVQKQHKVIRDRHFEIFGMDLMLDKDMKVWMCEVNTDPGLGYPDEKVLDSPNPDYQKELRACEETMHDLFALLGLDAGREQAQGSLRHWFELDFNDKV